MSSQKSNRWFITFTAWVVVVMFLSVEPAVVWAQTAAKEKNKEAKPLKEKCSHFQLCGVDVALEKDGIHDPRNEAIKVLQPPAEAMAGFPRTETGVIDWVKVLDEELIQPRTGLVGDEKMYFVDFDIIFKNTASMPYVRFPHKPHTKWLTCANCHPKIFIPQRGANHVTMAEIMSGQYCGVCHGKVAFPPLECTRCHRVPRESTGLR